jgi:hypothetical protein
MSADWFFTNYPASRSVIENDLRLRLWASGFKGMWVSCTKDSAPFECKGNWSSNDFVMEWEPKNYLLIKMKAPNPEVLSVFERALKHKALAAYKNADGVVVEWRVNNADARFQELQASGVAELERLDE